jgi:uncharacterized protein (DUF608 family)
MNNKIITLCVVLAICVSSALALNGTRGVPLGGLGTGYVKYDPASGLFATSGKQPPPAADGDEWAGGKYVSSNSGFHFYVKPSSGAAQVKNQAKTSNEDGKIPVHTADYGDLGNVNFKLVAFGPYNVGDTNLAMLPCAFFEIQAQNKNTEAVDVAVAMAFTNANSGGNNLLGGANTGTMIAINGQNRAIGYGSMSGSDNACLLAGADGASPTYSVGSAIDAFNSSGVLSNANGNIVAVKLSVAPNSTGRFQFVLSWYRTFRSGGTTEDYYYNNFFANSQEIAQSVIERFGPIRDGAQYIVNRTIAVNLPGWFTDRMCNNLYTIVHNSQMAKDGRVAFWEGRYSIIGTLDQTGHMALFPSFSWPSHQWRQMEYWARRAYQGADAGQIHHDHNSGQDFNGGGRFIHGWDVWDVQDYPYCPDTRDWADLNCMLIFGVFELFEATGDVTKLTKMWPYLKTTGERLRKQCTWNGAPANQRHLPYLCKCSYDGNEASDMGAFNGSVALCAYQCMKEMAKAMNEQVEETKWDTMYTKGRAEFANVFVKNANFCTTDRIAESNVGGYGFAHCYGFPAMWDSSDAEAALTKVVATHTRPTDLRAKLGWSSFYTADHLGGYATSINHTNVALQFHFWDWQYGYEHHECAYWQNLFDDANDQFYSYCTGPFVWRSLFQIEGYWIDMYNKRLFIRPSLPDSMVAASGSGFQKGQLRNAPLPTPFGWGTLNYTEDEAAKQTQHMTISFDKALPSGFNELILKNNTGLAQPFVSVLKGGAPVVSTATTEGAGFEKIIRVAFATPLEIDQQGIDVTVSKEQIAVPVVAPRLRTPNSGVTAFLENGSIVASFSLDRAEKIRIEVETVDGRALACATPGMLDAGTHRIAVHRFDGSHGISAGSYLVRIVMEKGVMARIVAAGL